MDSRCSAWKAWNRRMLVGLAFAAAAVPAFNLVLDPYSIFGTANWLRQGYNLNERFNKVEFLRRNPRRFDSFIMGASTMGLFPTETARELHPSGRWYNLAYFAGTPIEALRTLRFLKQQGVAVNEVLFGIDMFAFRELDEMAGAAWKAEHPMVAGMNKFEWVLSNAFAASFVDGLGRVTHSFNREPRMWFDIEGTGMYHLLNWDRQIELDHQAFIEKQVAAKHTKWATSAKRSGVTFIQARFDELAALKAWLADNGVRYQFWLNPIHHVTLEALTEESVERFRTKVREAVGNVPDYTRRSDICDDDHLFYDRKHFRGVAARMILREVLGRNSGDGGFFGLPGSVQ